MLLEGIYGGGAAIFVVADFGFCFFVLGSFLCGCFSVWRWVCIWFGCRFGLHSIWGLVFDLVRFRLWATFGFDVGLRFELVLELVPSFDFGFYFHLVLIQFLKAISHLCVSERTFVTAQ